MKRLLLVLVVLCIATPAFAQRGTKIRFGLLGTTIRAGCGANVCASPCGAKVTYGGYGGGYYGAGGCASGYCGGGGYSSCGSGGCAPACATNGCATCPTCPQPCATCPQPYGVRTHTSTCTDSYLPPEQAAVQQLRYVPQQQQLLVPQQFGVEGGPRVVYYAY